MISKPQKALVASLLSRSMGLELVELVLDWEERFDLHLSDAEFANMRNARQVIDTIYARLVAQGNPRTWTRDSVRDNVRDSLISKGLAPPDFSDGAAFMRDLGLG